jgi:hypothetical protein
MKSLLLHCKNKLRPEDITRMEKELTEKIGVKVVIIDGDFTGEIYTIE